MAGKFGVLRLFLPDSNLFGGALEILMQIRARAAHYLAGLCPNETFKELDECPIIIQYSALHV